MIATRRSFLAGLASILAAPVIVRAASLMPVRVVDAEVFVGTMITSIPDLLTFNMITREAVRLWHDSNKHIKVITEEYDRYTDTYSLTMRLPQKFKI